MGRCVYCNSMVPLNTETCVVCEASITDQNQPQMSNKIAQSKVCQYCGTGEKCVSTVKRLSDVSVLCASTLVQICVCG